MALLQASRNQSSIIQVNSKLDILDTKISSIATTTTSSSHQITHQSSLQLMQNRPVSPRHGTTYTNSIFKSIEQYRTNFFLGTFSFRTTSTTYRYDDNDSTDDANNSTTTKAYLVEFLIGFTTCRKGFRVMTTNTFDNYRLDVIRQQPYDSEIFILCWNGDAGAVKRLLDRGEASIYDVDEYGDSLLHRAAACPKPELCQMLLNLEADVNLQNNHGNLPIVDAVEQDRSESFNLLCEAGGYDPWPLDGSLTGETFDICNTISAWRYIYQVRPHASIGENLLKRTMRGITHAKDTELVDFLLPRFTTELFQYGNSVPRHWQYPFWYLSIGFIFSSWLESMYIQWFHGSYLFESANLAEYKLIQILKQISPRLNPTTRENWHSGPYDIVDIYMHAVEKSSNPTVGVLK
ncbi:hypothetical protein EAF04_010372 [Stromatinia cepivora]|nr:hypothetical protein EAF04_010372 [Stromatinia cepivora]